jgi:zinc-binding alcohol dehydrogenase family protein
MLTDTRVKACSVNPVDTKVRKGTYDDYPDYFSKVPKPYQIIGFDGAGTIEAVGSEVKDFKPGDDVFYSGSPIRHGSNAEYQLVDSRSIGPKPKSLNFVQAAALPLTYITAYEALVERMEIRKGEKAGILIINGAGGVGSVASQIARHVLELPVVVTTASRDETVKFSKSMGATHVVNHREPLAAQIRDLHLEYPIKYIFITSRTEQYFHACGEICAPFGKVCSIVQTEEMNKMYGTEFMAKSLSFIWELLGTKPYYGVDVNSHGNILQELASLVEKGVIKSHATKTLPLTLEGVREGHRLVEAGGSIGKNALGIEEDGVGDAAFG